MEEERLSKALGDDGLGSRGLCGQFVLRVDRCAAGSGLLLSALTDSFIHSEMVLMLRP